MVVGSPRELTAADIRARWAHISLAVRAPPSTTAVVLPMLIAL